MLCIARHHNDPDFVVAKSKGVLAIQRTFFYI